MAINERRLQPNELGPDMYYKRVDLYFKVIATGIVVLLFAFLFNISIERKIHLFVSERLALLPNCAIQYEKLQLHYFPLGISIKKIEIPGTCFNQVEQKLPLSDLNLSLAFPSFYPVGPRLKVELKEGKSLFTSYLTLSFFSHVLEIPKSTLDLSLLNPLVENGKFPLKGSISFAGSLKFNLHELIDGSFSADSKNLVLPAQSINNFEITLTPIHLLSLRMQMSSKNKWTIEKLDFGKKMLPIEIRSKGDLLVNLSQPGLSMLHLTGTLNLSKEFSDTYSFLLAAFLPPNNQTGLYKAQLQGPVSHLGMPVFSP